MHGSEVDERSIASGTVKSIGGDSFVLTTKQGELTVITSADTNFHSPRQMRQAAAETGGGHKSLTFATLKIGQRVAVQGERRDDTTLVAERVHIPNP